MEDTLPLHECLRQTYSSDGIEVEGVGDGRLQMRMPPAFHDVSHMCNDLIVKRGAAPNLFRT